VEIKASRDFEIEARIVRSELRKVGEDMEIGRDSEGRLVVAYSGPEDKLQDACARVSCLLGGTK